LFDISLYENIIYGIEPHVSREEVRATIEKNGLSPIFKNISGDYLDSLVGIDGNKLSGGQRQMVLIIRAVLKKNKIVILDEPTSAMDAESKALVLRAIHVLCKHETLILITHDKDVLSLVERVITLDAGKIVSDVPSWKRAF
jgi:ABC-type bacteriocin/lantibiotic exporter with double-glycine peptidase domain